MNFLSCYTSIIHKSIFVAFISMAVRGVLKQQFLAIVTPSRLVSRLELYPKMMQAGVITITLLWAKFLSAKFRLVCVSENTKVS